MVIGIRIQVQWWVALASSDLRSFLLGRLGEARITVPVFLLLLKLAELLLSDTEALAMKPVVALFTAKPRLPE